MVDSIIIGVVILLAIFAVILGLARDDRLARLIGNETAKAHPKATPDDPVVLLEKLHRLYEAGALTQAEYETQKARILGS